MAPHIELQRAPTTGGLNFPSFVHLNKETAV